VAVTGVGATGSVSNVKILATKRVLGVTASGQMGVVSVKVTDIVTPIGVSGVGAVGTVNIRGWTVINDSQTPDWTEINT
jgi:hypothetical protein